MASKGNAEYLPPIVTEFKADLSDLHRGIMEAKKAQKDYAKDTEDLADTFKRTGTEADRAGGRINEFEKLVKARMREGESAVSALRGEYARLHEKAKEIKRDLNKGDGDQGQLFGNLREVMGNLNKIRQMGMEVGLELGQATSKGFGSVVAATGPYGMAAIVTAAIGAAVLSAPIIGAAIATALTLGLGGGVIGLGAMILGDDKKIQAKAEKLAKTTSGIFQRAADPLKGPFLKALDTIESRFKKMEPEFKKLFAAAAPLVQPLTEGFMGMLSNMLPGLTEGLKNSAPLFETLGRELPKLGTAIGSFFALISKDSEGMSQFFTDLITGVSKTIVLLGYLVWGLTEAYGWIRRFSTELWTGLGKAWDKFIVWKNDLVKWSKDALKSVGAWLLFGFLEGVKQGFRDIKNDLENIWNGITGSAQTALRTHSPSEVFKEIGEDTMEGYAIGVSKNAHRAWAAWAGLTAPTAAPRGSFSGGHGVSSAMTVRRPASADGYGQQLQPIVLKIDSRTVLDVLVPTAQRYKQRTGVSGVS